MLVMPEIPVPQLSQSEGIITGLSAMRTTGSLINTLYGRYDPDCDNKQWNDYLQRHKYTADDDHIYMLINY